MNKIKFDKTLETHSYTWTKAQSPRGSSKIVSALHNLLPIQEEARLQAQVKNVELPMTLQLFSDATSIQNKNTTMMAYLLSYAQRSQVFNKIKHVFPITHSFMC